MVPYSRGHLSGSFTGTIVIASVRSAIYSVSPTGVAMTGTPTDTDSRYATGNTSW